MTRERRYFLGPWAKSKYWNVLESTHGKLEDAVSNLSIKDKRFAAWALHSVTYPLVFWDQFQEITLGVNTRTLEGIDDWTKYIVYEQLLRFS